MCVFVSSSARP